VTKPPKQKSASKSAASLAKILAQSAGAKQLRGEIAAKSSSSNDEGTAQSIPSMSKRIIEVLNAPSTTNTATATRFVKPESRASLVLKRLPPERSPTNSRLPKLAGAPTEIQTTADLGQLVRRAREDKGLTQQEFADLTGVGRRFVSELENGKPTIEFGKALKVALGAGISIHGRQR
jgi:HTH-type transcriptional regulator/antitoxin HipB